MCRNISAKIMSRFDQKGRYIFGRKSYVGSRWGSPRLDCVLTEVLFFVTFGRPAAKHMYARISSQITGLRTYRKAVKHKTKMWASSLPGIPGIFDFPRGNHCLRAIVLPKIRQQGKASRRVCMIHEHIVLLKYYGTYDKK